MGKNIADETKSAIRKCAFCRNWYDPANSAIKKLNFRIWEYNPQMSCICSEKKLNTFASQTCSKFVSKI